MEEQDQNICPFLCVLHLRNMLMLRTYLNLSILFDYAQASTSIGDQPYHLSNLTHITEVTCLRKVVMCCFCPWFNITHAPIT